MLLILLLSTLPRRRGGYDPPEEKRCGKFEPEVYRICGLQTERNEHEKYIELLFENRTDFMERVGVLHRAFVLLFLTYNLVAGDATALKAAAIRPPNLRFAHHAVSRRATVPPQKHTNGA